MISAQILQSTIDGLKAITRVDLCVLDTEGKVVAGTYAETKEHETSVRAFIESSQESQLVQGCHYFKVYDEYHLEYVLLVYGGSEETHTIGKLVVFQIQSFDLICLLL